VTTQTNIILLGQGRLTWSRYERIGDRYGAVSLMTDGDSLNGVGKWVPISDEHDGQHGTLAAEVLETRDSTHIGDLFRGLFPETPEVGERIVLGQGTLFTERADLGAVQVGLRPDDGRKVDWLNPEKLYRAHEQTVRLLFMPDPAPTASDQSSVEEGESP